MSLEVRGVCVKLKTEWMGNPPGRVIKLPPRIAQNLFQSDTAEIIHLETDEEIKSKMQPRARDKMIRRSINK